MGTKRLCVCVCVCVCARARLCVCVPSSLVDSAPNGTVAFSLTRVTNVPRELLSWLGQAVSLPVTSMF